MKVNKIDIRFYSDKIEASLIFHHFSKDDLLLLIKYHQ